MQLKAEGSIPTLAEEKRYHALLSSAERKVFGANRFDIVLCTCNEAASNRVSKHVHPHQCIVDECGFAIEPDVMIPLQLSQHVVLIGDHKQLQPVIKNRCACASVCVCMCLCMCVCACVLMCINACIHTLICMFTLHLFLHSVLLVRVVLGAPSLSAMPTCTPRLERSRRREEKRPGMKAMLTHSCRSSTEW